MQIESANGKWKAIIADNGNVSIWPTKPRETKDPDPSMQRLMAGMNTRPELEFNFHGGDVWNIDTDAGAQRYNGQTSTKKIISFLRILGFDKIDVTTILGKARTHTHLSAPMNY